MRISVPLLGLVLVAFTAGAERAPLERGEAFDAGGVRYVVTTLDALPYVESDFTKRFTFDSFDNPKLKQLRERYRLDEVVAAGRDEFDRQVLLLDWVHNRFKKFGRPSSPARGADEILKAIDAGHTFFCAHYADVLASTAASLGWVDRLLALRRPDDRPEGSGGSTEHTSTEIWSNQYRKWVMFDPTFAMYVEKDGVPLSAYELRQAWFYEDDGKHLTFVVGKERKRYTRADMPVLRHRFEGFGNLNLDPSGVNVYAFIGYVPNTNVMDAGLDYGKMFITKDDKVCAGTKWHTRVGPKDPAVDPYFPINQAAVTLSPEGDGLRVRLRTMTPNFKAFAYRVDGGEWKEVGEGFVWRVHTGENRVEVKAVNRFGVEGPVSVVEVVGKRG
jgi:hypothetical protein